MPRLFSDRQRMDNKSGNVTRKTFKRETGWLLLAFWVGMTIWGVYEPVAHKAAETMLAPIFLFLAAALGVDAYSKQILPIRKGQPE